MTRSYEQPMPPHAIAVVGMVGRFPGANDVSSLWANVLAGREGITFFADEELDAGIAPRLRNDPAYVRAKGLMPDCDCFDAAFFGASPLEAQVLDPQHRVLLELAWSALENSGHRAADFGGRIGVYVGANWNSYLTANVATRPEVVAKFGELNTALANEQDFLATRISYKLNLKGPSYTVNTACSTSLVAITQAARTLVSGDCDLALAGGVSISVPVRKGYLSEAGGMLSSDGHCRPFDAGCSGTTFNDGAGVVVLRRLADAVADGDHIHAVIRGFAVNNDGSDKVSFTAPSVAGQAAVLGKALAHAAVDPGSIGYIETHGTATPMGDPIEFAALSRVFQGGDASDRACAIGSVKSSVGHLVHAAGVTGFIMAVLAVQKAIIPPTLFFRKPNPRLRMDRTRFYVPREPQPWPESVHPRRAGVSSFGVGGTNCHVVIEQAPAVLAQRVGHATEQQAAQHGLHLLCLSAKTEAALARQVESMSQFFQAPPPELSLTSLAWTLQQGREPMRYRLAACVATLADGAVALGERRHACTGDAVRSRGIVFQLPGYGVQRPGMGRELYKQSPVFRLCLDEGMALLRGIGGADIRSGLLEDSAASKAEFADIRIALPALFLFEYSLAVTLERSGLIAETLLGCSLGEFVVAVLAGVLSLEDALRVVVASAEGVIQSPAGRMITVFCSEAEVREMVCDDVAVAGVHAADIVVLSGTPEKVEAVRAQLEQRGVHTLDLPSERAFHSPLMEPVTLRLEGVLRGIKLSAPRRQVWSSMTGRELTAEEATEPAYWAQTLCRPIRFADALGLLGDGAEHILVEVGPGRGLTNLALSHPGASRSIPIAALPGSGLDRKALQELENVAAHCWVNGGEVDFGKRWSGAAPRRLQLPTYCFERTRHWLEPQTVVTAADSETQAQCETPDLAVGTVRTAAGLRAVRSLVEQQIALMQSQLKIISAAEQRVSHNDLPTSNPDQIEPRP
ncbi:MAG: phthiocerol/phenolphthiocerol synthesis type-I polyketide synthase E [Planctomycetota bacterium]|jgi:phthiocerol/phenolphthiocerol synthesis type-I polyketide synthase E